MEWEQVALNVTALQQNETHSFEVTNNISRMQCLYLCETLYLIAISPNDTL